MPAPRELPAPDPAMTERVVAAALAALPKRPPWRRGRVLSVIAIAIAVAIAFGLAAAPSESGIPRYPLSFVSIHHGGTPARTFASSQDTAFALAHSRFQGADGFARILDLDAPAIAALDRVDFNKHFVVFVVRRGRAVAVRKLKLRSVRGGLQLCVYFRDRGTGTEGQPFGYDLVSVRKTPAIQRVSDQLTGAGSLLFDARGKLVDPGPLGNLRPALCR
jgi:hypothetical protein